MTAKKCIILLNIETGTDFVDKGCNNSTNRLYYEIEKVVLFNPSANDNKSCYTVSQVRMTEKILKKPYRNRQNRKE